jgi:hypothetical protein
MVSTFITEEPRVHFHAPFIIWVPVALQRLYHNATESNEKGLHYLTSYIQGFVHVPRYGWPVKDSSEKLGTKKQNYNLSQNYVWKRHLHHVESNGPITYSTFQRKGSSVQSKQSSSAIHKSIQRVWPRNVQVLYDTKNLGTCNNQAKK